MTTEIKCTCKLCNNEIIVRGKWYNQLTLNHWHRMKIIGHACIHHASKITAKGWVHVMKMLFLSPIMVVMEILYIVIFNWFTFVAVIMFIGFLLGKTTM